VGWDLAVYKVQHIDNSWARAQGLRCIHGAGGLG
jgi:hypothetical protein